MIESTSSRRRDKEATDNFDVIEGDATSSISNSHGLGVVDLVVVEHDSVPVMTSRKVRRAACVKQCRQDQFARLIGLVLQP